MSRSKKSHSKSSRSASRAQGGKRKKKAQKVPAKSSGKVVPSRKPSLKEAFINALKVENYKPRTIESYCMAVKMLQTFLGRSPLDNITVNDIRAFFFISLKSANILRVHSIRCCMV